MLTNYLKIAIRHLWKNKLLTFLNLAGLTTGITVFAMIMVWVNHEFSFDRFYPDVNRTYRIHNTFFSESESFSQAPSGPGIGEHITEEIPEIESAMRVGGESAKVRVGENIFFENEISLVDSNFFSFFGHDLLKGDPATALNNPKSIVLTEGMVKKYFGNEEALNKIVQLDDKIDLTVTGVIVDPPANASLRYDFLMPVDYLKLKYNWDGYKDQWLGGWMYTYIKARDGVSKDLLEKKVNDVIHKHSEKEYKEYKVSYTYTLQPMADVHLHSSLRYDHSTNGNIIQVYIFGTIGIIVLILACINYTNLATAASLSRAKEVGLRKVTGAQSGQIIFQHLTESVLLSLVTVIFSLAVMEVFLKPFELLTQREFIINRPLVAGIVLAVGILVGIVAGFYPSFVLSSLKPSGILKGNFKFSLKGQELRKALVVFQYTVTISLLIALLIVNQQLSFIQSRNLGYDKEAVINIDFRGVQKVRDQFANLRNELLAYPSIKNVSAHSSTLGGGLGNSITSTENAKGEEISTSLYDMRVDDHYFDTHGMKLAAGRFFSEDFPLDSTHSVMVNEAAVRNFGWGAPEKAIGKRFWSGKDVRFVVGVVKDFHFETLRKPIDPVLILHTLKNFSMLSLRCDKNNLPESISSLERTWKKLLPDTPLSYSFLDQDVDREYGSEKSFQSVFKIFSVISFVIASLGLFGLTVYAGQSRTKEIGIRKVLGATGSHVLLLLSRDFMILVLVSLCIAIPLAWYAMEQWLKEFAFRIEISVWTMAGAAMIALGVAFLTMAYQVIKSVLKNPVDSLRYE